ncbi:hypothetical protein BOTBODRAFT_32939 [Botryobasidium botryosum FD-172 SS1]|uniref:Fido domain-containing protein n=1 Tax=Botryobasidium botryosum (strain FD-172 SS1) TaxID=930990 RepID=A0A067MQI2_BOTB1|nr:hypothetical protein BOTBODRAFT_32939 [Botryobasidium botryosum FD-172 SS1]
MALDRLLALPPPVSSPKRNSIKLPLEYAAWTKDGPLDTFPSFDAYESSIYDDVLVNFMDPSFLVQALENDLLPRQRVPFILVRTANVRASLQDLVGAEALYTEAATILGDSDPVFIDWLEDFKHVVQQKKEEYMVVWRNAPGVILEDWVPTADLAELPTEPVLSPDMASIASRWRAMREHAPETVERYLKSASVDTNLVESVFSIPPNSISNVIRIGFYYNSIEDVERRSSLADPDDIIRILKDTHKSLQRVFDIAAQKIALTTDEVFELHRSLMVHQKVTSRRPYRYVPTGRVRDHGVFVNTGMGYVRFCPPDQVREEIEAVVNHAQELMAQANHDPFSVAAWIHSAFVNCHPFADGNGRISRLLASIPLIQADLPPITIPPNMFKDYIHALREARLHGNYERLTQVFAQGMISTIENVERLPALTDSDRLRCSAQGRHCSPAYQAPQDDAGDVTISL